MATLLTDSRIAPAAQLKAQRNTAAKCELVAQTCGGKVFCVCHGLMGVPHCSKCPLSADEKHSIRERFRAVQSVLYFFLN